MPRDGGTHAPMDPTCAILASAHPHWSRTIAVAAATALQLPVGPDFPGEPFLLYFVAVVASASVLGRTAGFVAVAETSIASLLFFDPGYSLKVTHTVDLLAIEMYAVIAALTVEAFCRVVDTAISVEARLADSE